MPRRRSRRSACDSVGATVRASNGGEQRGQDRLDAGDGGHRRRRRARRCGSAPTSCSTRLAAAGACSPRIAFGVVGFLVGVVLSRQPGHASAPGGRASSHWVWLPLVPAGRLRGRRARASSRSTDATPAARSSASPPALADRRRPSACSSASEYRPSLDSVPFVVWTVGRRRRRRRPRAVLRRRAPRRARRPDRAARIGVADRWVGWRRARRRLGRRGDRRHRPCPPVLIGVRLGLTTQPRPDRRGRASTAGRGPCIFLAPGAAVHPRRARDPDDPHDLPVAPRRQLRRSSSGSTTTSTRSPTRRAGTPSNWTNMFTSRLFFIGIVLLADRDRRRRRSRSGAPGAPSRSATRPSRR